MKIILNTMVITQITAKRKATVLSQALPYIKKFNNKVVVVKLGGSALTDKNLICHSLMMLHG